MNFYGPRWRGLPVASYPDIIRTALQSSGNPSRHPRHWHLYITYLFGEIMFFGKSTIGIAGLGMVLTALTSAPLAAGGRGNSTPNPVIVSVSVAPQTDEVTIRGHAFGSDAPLVILGDQRLVVKQNSEKQIVAALPGNMPSAAYSLFVIRNKNLQSLPFTLLVMAD